MQLRTRFESKCLEIVELSMVLNHPGTLFHIFVVVVDIALDGQFQGEQVNDVFMDIAIWPGYFRYIVCPPWFVFKPVDLLVNRSRRG